MEKLHHYSTLSDHISLPDGFDSFSLDDIRGVLQQYPSMQKAVYASMIHDCLYYDSTDILPGSIKISGHVQWYTAYDQTRDMPRKKKKHTRKVLHGQYEKVLGKEDDLSIYGYTTVQDFLDIWQTITNMAALSHIPIGTVVATIYIADQQLIVRKDTDSTCVIDVPSVGLVYDANVRKDHDFMSYLHTKRELHKGSHPYLYTASQNDIVDTEMFGDGKQHLSFDGLRDKFIITGCESIFAQHKTAKALSIAMRSYFTKLMKVLAEAYDEHKVDMSFNPTTKSVDVSPLIREQIVGTLRDKGLITDMSYDSHLQKFIWKVLTDYRQREKKDTTLPPASVDRLLYTNLLLHNIYDDNTHHVLLSNDTDFSLFSSLFFSEILPRYCAIQSINIQSTMLKDMTQTELYRVFKQHRVIQNGQRKDYIAAMQRWIQKGLQRVEADYQGDRKTAFVQLQPDSKNIHEVIYSQPIWDMLRNDHIVMPYGMGLLEEVADWIHTDPVFSAKAVSIGDNIIQKLYNILMYGQK